MRTRSILLVVAILLVAGFAALNWSEVVRPAPLLFGPVAIDAPLGAILLALLAITLVLFLASTAAMRTQSLLDYRAHQKTLEAQRELADKAEASRFVELRQHMDEHLNRLGERDSLAATEFDKAMAQSRRELQVQLGQINRTIAARLNEIEHRLDSRLGGAPVGMVPPVMRSESAVDAEVVREREDALARDAERVRAQELRDEERLREQAPPVRPVERAADRPAEAGWRKWF